MRALALLLSAALSAGIAVAAPIDVVVSVLPQKFLAERVGGKHVRVSAMVVAGQEPHAYEPTPRQMAALSEARLYFALQTPFDRQWLPRMRAVNADLRIVESDDGIAFLLDEDARHDHGHESDDAAQRHAAPAHDKGPAIDPHVWLAPANARRIASNMKSALAAADPQHSDDYERNFARLAAELDALDADIRAQLDGTRSRTFLVFHPAWGYFAAAFGLTQLAIEVDGKEVGSRTLEHVVERARSAGARSVFVQPQFSPAAAATVAAALGGRVVSIDPMAEDYIANLRDVAARIHAALDE